MKHSKHTAGYFAAFGLIDSLIELMTRKGVTRSKLAEITGESRPTVSKWFSPGRNLTIFTAASIASALGAELKISVVEKAAATAPSEDITLWGVGSVPERATHVRVVEPLLQPGGAEEGVSAAVPVLRFVEDRRTGRPADTSFSQFACEENHGS